MARLSSINTNNRRQKMAQKFAARREKLKEIISNKEVSLDERIQATIKLSELPRNSSKIRFRNRCEVTGRPRAFYRKFRMSRIALRELGSLGLIPGLTKSSW
ncbi:30S ribosomal protein S14 [Candidatus Odyssella acanthamoebae]|uniref:Small ribosomal subunit protein uS14 n=1 Tax=Candidatus Odyssella acanthamoebae TaxID=91604 RepID=A0A077AXM5_9PROT|nr:30S ribosomal protein S14 [Candidatus Paracaedibacter acanthamoebae]AIK96754.1 30S ribosomal protein S14 [Candidatus Paracaedibacter acanthamoebae]